MAGNASSLLVALAIWLPYIWANLLLLDWILQFVGEKEHPVIKKLHTPIGDFLAMLVFLSWFTVIGAIISGWLGLIPAVIVNIVIRLFSKRNAS